MPWGWWAGNSLEGNGKTSLDGGKTWFGAKELAFTLYAPL